MKALVTGLLAATAAILAVAPVANAEYFIPPGNSGATQYTEALPTAGGNNGADGGETREAHPGKVIGQKNASKLEAQGAQGREVAEIVAATAPPSVATDATAEESSDRGEKKKQQQGGGADKGDAGKSGDGKDGNGNGAAAKTEVLSEADPAGDTAVGQVAGKVTGLSTGGSSLLLPLAILAGLVWAAVYSVRRRQRPTP